MNIFLTSLNIHNYLPKDQQETEVIGILISLYQMPLIILTQNVFKFWGFYTDISTAYLERQESLVKLCSGNTGSLIFTTNLKFPTDYFLLAVDSK